MICHNCPFRREGGISLVPARKREIARSLRKGGMFPCHKTVDYSNDDDGRVTSKSKFCGGAIATMNNEGGAGCMQNQMARICARLGMLDPDDDKHTDLVFESLQDWCDD